MIFLGFRFQHHVCARSNFICAKANTCRQTRNGKAEPLQSRRQQRVLFEAISAAPIAHEFGLQTSQIEQNRFAEEDVEIFEWNVRRVRAMNGVQSLCTGVAFSGIIDACQIRIEVERFGLFSHSAWNLCGKPVRGNHRNEDATTPA